MLDVMPGQVLKGRVRSVGSGVGSGKQAQPGTLPDGREQPRLAAAGAALPGGRRIRPFRARAPARVRIGGQADVLVYTGDHALMNWLGAVFIRLMSYLSYLY